VIKINLLYIYIIYMVWLIIQYLLIPRALPLAKTRQFIPRDRAFFFATSQALLIVYCVWVSILPEVTYKVSGYIMLFLTFAVCWFRCGKMFQSGDL